jgi:D-glycero-alpha-D-manno-heptose-7-phosphate kinase
VTQGRNPATERRRVVEASAPCRVDLTGGVLDAWPLYLFHPGAVAVTVAIDRRVTCRVETGIDGVEIESKDSLRKLRARTVAELLSSDGAGLAAYVLQALGVETGVRVVTQTRVAAGSRLGSASALAAALAAAVARVIGRELGQEEAASLCRDVEVQAGALPAGVRGGYTALRGGVLAFDLGPGGVRVERPLVDPGRIEESLILVDAGPDAASGGAAWEAIKGQIEGDGTVRQALAAIAAVSRQAREALVAGRCEELTALMAQEWEARKRLGAGSTTASIDGIVETVRAAGGAALAGEGVVMAWSPPGERGPGRREAVAAALQARGLRRLPLRVDLRGLDVEDVA